MTIERYHIHLYIEVQALVEAPTKEAISLRIGSEIGKLLRSMMPADIESDGMVTIYGSVEGQKASSAGTGTGTGTLQN